MGRSEERACRQTGVHPRNQREPWRPNSTPTREVKHFTKLPLIAFIPSRMEINLKGLRVIVKVRNQRLRTWPPAKTEPLSLQTPPSPETPPCGHLFPRSWGPAPARSSAAHLLPPACGSTPQPLAHRLPAPALAIRPDLGTEAQPSCWGRSPEARCAPAPPLPHPSSACTRWRDRRAPQPEGSYLGPWDGELELQAF